VRAGLERAILDKSSIQGADFSEARLDNASMQLVTGAPEARNLLTTKVAGDVEYFSSVVRDWPEYWVDWERIRIAGRLPLFGASYSGLIIIPTYVYLLGIYNDKVEATRAWITQTSGTLNGLPVATATAILEHLHVEPIPESFFLLLISTFCLAIAATIYALACPARVKEFSREQWCHELGHSLVHYWPEAWKRRTLRLACAILYTAGGLGAGYVLAQKLVRVALILYESP